MLLGRWGMPRGHGLGLNPGQSQAEGAQAGHPSGRNGGKILFAGIGVLYPRLSPAPRGGWGCRRWFLRLLLDVKSRFQVPMALRVKHTP